MPLTWTAPAVEADDRWRVEASCRHTDPDLFFPIGTTGPAIDHIAQAKAVCGACPVQAPCLEYALLNRIDHGVWGGTSERERRRILKRRRLAVSVA